MQKDEEGGVTLEKGIRGACQKRSAIENGGREQTLRERWPNLNWPDICTRERERERERSGNADAVADTIYEEGERESHS